MNDFRAPLAQLLVNLIFGPVVVGSVPASRRRVFALSLVICMYVFTKKGLKYYISCLILIVQALHNLEVDDAVW